MDSSQRIGVVAFLVIGLGLFVGAAFAARSAWTQREVLATHTSWPRTEGEVISVAPDRDGQGDTFYWVETRWAGADGVPHTARAVSTSSSSIGTRIPLRYDPADPSHAESPDARESWGLTLILAAMGVGFLGIAGRVTVRELDGRRA